MNKNSTFLLVALSVMMVTAAFSTSVRAEDKETRPEVPGFRTDLGIHVSVGGHQCLRSSSGYAICRDADAGWDPSFGIAGGVIVRPFPYFSVGIDASYMNMKGRWKDTTRWTDISFGPVVQGHLPIKIVRVVLEPRIGLQGGYVQGNMVRKEDDNQLRDTHIGPFIAPLAGLDLFVLPGFGFGFEVRVIRTFYQEVCFESSRGSTCRGVNDDESNSHWNEFYPGDGPLAEYPWKIFYGGHLLYYF